MLSESCGSLLIAVAMVHQSLTLHSTACIIPSLGSATANETFFSSLIESSNVDNRGVTFPSTTAAACSRASKGQHADLVARCRRFTGDSTVELVEIFELQAVGRGRHVSAQRQAVEAFR